MQSQLKVLAPVMTRDVTLPNSSKKVPMVMVPVPDSKTLMAIPLSTLSQMTTTTTTTAAATGGGPRATGTKDEQQAKDLLNWNDGIGTLVGCDLRFKINQLGCLELLDSEDESSSEYSKDKEHHNSQQQRQHHPPPHIPYQHQPQHCQDANNHQKIDQKVNNSNNNTSCSNTNAISNNCKKVNKIKQISPGSSLLRDGPDNRRARASSSSNVTTPQPTTIPTQSSLRNCSTTMPLSKKSETNQQTFLLEKLIPKKRIEEIKVKVENWSIEDVKKFVDDIPGCAGNGQLFESQQICGKSLMHLDQKDLIDIIQIRLGPAIKIYNAIASIKP